MGLFRSKQAEAADTVRQKLDAARADLTDARGRLRSRAIEIAMASDPFAAEADFDAVRRAEERVGILENALADLETEEQARIADARRRERKSQIRAYKHRLARMTKAAAKLETAIAAYRDSFRELEDEARGAMALVPPARALNEFADLTPASLARLAHIELYRVGSTRTEYRPQRLDLPGSEGSTVWAGTVPATLPPISEVVAQRAQFYGARYENLIGAVELGVAEPDKAVATQEPPPPVADPAPVVEAAADAEPPAAIRQPGSSPGNPHPPGSEEWHEYEAAFADIHRGRQPAAPPLAADDGLIAEPAHVATVEPDPEPEAVEEAELVALATAPPGELSPSALARLARAVRDRTPTQ